MMYLRVPARAGRDCPSWAWGGVTVIIGGPACTGTLSDVEVAHAAQTLADALRRVVAEEILSYLRREL